MEKVKNRNGKMKEDWRNYGKLGRGGLVLSRKLRAGFAQKDDKRILLKYHESYISTKGTGTPNAIS